MHNQRYKEFYVKRERESAIGGFWSYGLWPNSNDRRAFGCLKGMIHEEILRHF